jgi:hypothetical protein
MSEDKAVCGVCEEVHHRLYSVAKCSHRFCRRCSVAYIDSQASNFAAACCLQEGCGATLDKSLPIYRLLEQPTLRKLEKYNAYLFLQQNPGYLGCRTRDCSGAFKMKEGRCSVCSAVHCKRCGELQHEGACV